MTIRQQAADLLRAARALLARQGGWCKGVSRRYRGSTVSYCALGACQVNAHGVIDGVYLTAVTELRKAAEEPHISLWNDHSTKRQVLAGFDAAIAELENTNG